MVAELEAIGRALVFARETGCALLADGPARGFGLAPAKGEFAVGADANVALLDPAGSWTVGREDLLDRQGSRPSN